MNIVWSENAEITFDAIVVYIRARFGPIAAKKFVIKSDSIIGVIAMQPLLYKKSSLKSNIRIAVISKHCSLVYKITDDNVELMYFWDTRREPIF